MTDQSAKCTPPLLNIMLSGATGKLGLAIQSCVDTDASLRVVSTATRSGFVDSPLGDVIIDVSHFSQTPHILAFAASHRIPIVIGTTALTPETEQMIHASAEMIPICVVKNFSLGALALEHAARLVSSIFPAERILITDRHHKEKQDAPSGTAIALKQAIEQQGLGVDQIDSRREGEVIGVHEVLFENARERIHIGHEVLNRQVFAEGALVVASKLRTCAAGVYTMAQLVLDA